MLKECLFHEGSNPSTNGLYEIETSSTYQRLTTEILPPTAFTMVKTQPSKAVSNDHGNAIHSYWPVIGAIFGVLSIISMLIIILVRWYSAVIFLYTLY